ncbi:MAG: MBL fold metallo-hydrolase [Parvularculaceae bacterium]
MITRMLIAVMVLTLAACGAQQKAAQIEGRGEDVSGWQDALPHKEWAAFERLMRDEQWFEVYRLSPDLYAIYEPGQFEEVLSFLIVGGERALLFDTGLGVDSIRRIAETLTDRDILVVNSHSHYDHVGGDHEFSAIAGPDVPFAREHQQGAPNADIREFFSNGWVWKNMPDGVSPKTISIKPYQVTQTIADGDVIDLGGVTLEVMLTPGHAPDALCLFDRENRRIFVGDTFYLAPLYAHLPGSDFEVYRATAARLAALAPNVDQVMTSHNVPIVASHYLTDMSNGFETIAAGNAPYVETDGAYEYDFGDFSIITPPR